MKQLSIIHRLLCWRVQKSWALSHPCLFPLFCASISSGRALQKSWVRKEDKGNDKEPRLAITVSEMSHWPPSLLTPSKPNAHIQLDLYDSQLSNLLSTCFHQNLEASIAPCGIGDGRGRLPLEDVTLCCFVKKGWCLHSTLTTLFQIMLEAAVYTGSWKRFLEIVCPQGISNLRETSASWVWLFTTIILALKRLR
jgi:hypothetical protein